MIRFWLLFGFARIAYSSKGDQSFEEAMGLRNPNDCKHTANKKIEEEIKKMEDPAQQISREVCYRCGKLLDRFGWCNDFTSGNGNRLRDLARAIVRRQKRESKQLYNLCNACTCGNCHETWMALATCRGDTDRFVRQREQELRAGTKSEGQLGKALDDLKSMTGGSGGTENDDDDDDKGGRRRKSSS